MRAAPPDLYRLTTLWRFNAPLESVWQAIADAPTWPDWWSGVENVTTLEPGDASGLGARRRYICKSTLPFQLTFVARVTRVVPLHLIGGTVEGELEGTGLCRLELTDDLTTVRYDWQVRTTRRWMNLLAPLAKPLFRWNHDQLMRSGGLGLQRHLAAHPEPCLDRKT